MITKVLYSPSQRLHWQVDFFPPDDEHEEDWVYPFVSASWPSDWTVGPPYPYNDQGIYYLAAYDENGVLYWKQTNPEDFPPIGGG